MENPVQIRRWLLRRKETSNEILLWYLDVICRIIVLLSSKSLWVYTRMKDTRIQT